MSNESPDTRTKRIALALLPAMAVTGVFAWQSVPVSAADESDCCAIGCFWIRIPKQQ